MATINLLPRAIKQARLSTNKNINALIKKSLKRPRPFLSFYFIGILVILGAWLTLLFQVRIKERALTLLDKKISHLKLDYREIEILNEKKEELNARLSFYQNIFENNIVWSKKLSLINKVIPDQIWLSSIYTETKPNKLVIKGSSTSLVSSEIIDSISQFVNHLKQESWFYNDFEEIKLGSLVSGKKGNRDVMNFSLICKFKMLDL